MQPSVWVLIILSFEYEYFKLSQPHVKQTYLLAYRYMNSSLLLIFFLSFFKNNSTIPFPLFVNVRLDDTDPLSVIKASNQRQNQTDLPFHGLYFSDQLINLPNKLVESRIHIGFLFLSYFQHLLFQCHYSTFIFPTIPKTYYSDTKLIGLSLQFIYQQSREDSRAPFLSKTSQKRMISLLAKDSSYPPPRLHTPPLMSHS